jgi:hypothetical protein
MDVIIDGLDIRLAVLLFHIGANSSGGKKISGIIEQETTLAGSGPLSWRHDNTLAGIADLVGNVWE